MLLTLSTTRRPATDLGYLLHKHPDRFQSYDLSFGKAHAYYPEATEDRCAACLLLDVDPVGIVRGKGASEGLLSQYVNDRPYVASSFLGVALSQVYGSARLQCFDDAVDKFIDRGDPRPKDFWAEGPRDISIDRVRGEVYIKANGNKTYRLDDNTAEHWSAITGNGSDASIALDKSHPLNEALTTAYISSYNLKTRSFTSDRYFVRYTPPQKCWFIDLGLVDKVNPHEFEFRFLFTLVGLSSSGRAAF